MGTIDHLLIDGETVEREFKHVNATLPFTKGRVSGALYLTDRRLVFRGKLLFKETIHDVPYSRIGDVASRSNGMSAAHVTVTTTSGESLQFAVKYNAAPALVSTIRAHQ